MTRMATRAVALAVVTISISGCVNRTIPIPDLAAPCRLDTLRPLVGRPGSAVLAAEALAQSDTRAVRWIRPGETVTMDYLQDRLNIHLSRDNIVKGFACG